MADKLEQLTKQIYEEGVEKAREEADKILEAAKEEKKRILKSAEDEAQEIKGKAQKQAEEMKARGESEFKLAAQKALAALRQKIAALISSKIAAGSAKEVFTDQDFIKKVIESVFSAWAGANFEQEALNLKLSSDLKDEIKNYFTEKVKAELAGKVAVKIDDKMKTGFAVEAADGSYKINFTEEDFKSLIEQYLPVHIKTFLFTE